MVGRAKTIPAGVVIEAKFTAKAPSFIKPSRQTGNRKVGVKYEEKAQKYIAQTLSKLNGIGEHLKSIPSPWIVFRSESDPADHVRYCQPDHLLIDEWQRKLTIIEIKLQHCLEAHAQIRLLYEPVLRKMYSGYSFAFIELVQWHDPHIGFPETYYFEPNITMAEVNKFGIHIWNPRYDKLSSAPATQSASSRSVPPLD